MKYATFIVAQEQAGVEIDAARVDERVEKYAAVCYAPRWSMHAAAAQLSRHEVAVTPASAAQETAHAVSCFMPAYMIRTVLLIRHFQKNANSASSSARAQRRLRRLHFPTA